MPNPFVSQSAQNIRSLIAEKRFKEAYARCQELQKKFPTEPFFVELEKEIEEEVQQENEERISEKLEALDELWEKEEYAKLIIELKNILAVVPHHKKALSQLEKAQKEYKKKMEEAHHAYETELRTRLEKLLSDEPEILPDELYIVETNNIEDPAMQGLVKEYRTRLIKKKIEEKHDLLRSEKHEAISHFINDLYRIDEDNELIQELEKKLKIHKSESALDAKGEYVYENIDHIKTLMQLKKYDKVLKAAEELLDIEPHNTFLRKIAQRAKKLLYTQTRDQVVDEMLKTQPQEKKEYKDNPDAFRAI